MELQINSLETRIEKMQGMYNKDLEEIKESIMNNTINEIENTAPVMKHLGKESACSAGDLGLIPGLGRSSGEANGHPLLYSWAHLWLSWERMCLQCGRPGFDSWVGKIPWRRKGYPLQYSGEFHGLYSSWGSQRVGHH